MHVPGRFFVERDPKKYVYVIFSDSCKAIIYVQISFLVFDAVFDVVCFGGSVLYVTVTNAELTDDVVSAVITCCCHCYCLYSICWCGIEVAEILVAFAADLSEFGYFSHPIENHYWLNSIRDFINSFFVIISFATL